MWLEHIHKRLQSCYMSVCDIVYPNMGQTFDLFYCTQVNFAPSPICVVCLAAPSNKTCGVVFLRGSFRCVMERDGQAYTSVLVLGSMRSCNCPCNCSSKAPRLRGEGMTHGCAACTVTTSSMRDADNPTSEVRSGHGRCVVLACRANQSNAHPHELSTGGTGGCICEVVSSSCSRKFVAIFLFPRRLPSQRVRGRRRP